MTKSAAIVLVCLVLGGLIACGAALVEMAW